MPTRILCIIELTNAFSQSLCLLSASGLETASVFTPPLQSPWRPRGGRVETAWRPRGSWSHSELHLRSGPLFSLFCVIVTSSIPASPYQHLSTPSPLPYPITLKNKQITQNQRRHQLPVAGFEWQVQVALSPSCVVSKGRRDSKCPMRPGLYTDNT